MQKIFFIIGASGSGKTSAVNALEKMGVEGLKVYYFDSIGVPSPEEMYEGWGSGEEWQRATTIEWVGRIKATGGVFAILDGQTRPAFIDEACKAHGIDSYEIILIDCSDDIRRDRLIRRGHAELADARMMDWARFLREETDKSRGTILNNDTISIAETATMLASIILGK